MLQILPVCQEREFGWMQMSFLLKRKLGEQEDGEDPDQEGRRCNEGGEVRHRPLSRLLSYTQAGSAVSGQFYY